MERIIRRDVVLGFVAGVIGLGSVVLVVSVFGSGGTQVCVPTREGKPITTPKGGTCKNGTLIELANGKSAAGVVARVRSIGPVMTASTDPEHPTYANDPLTGGSWTQGAQEVNQVFGEAEVTVPARSTCNVGPGVQTASGVALIQVNGKVIGEFHAPALGSPETVSGPIQWTKKGQGTPNNKMYFASVTSPVELLLEPEPGSDIAKTVTATVADSCGANGGTGGGHFTIDSIKFDVLGLR